jgi:hypothetical protein
MSVHQGEPRDMAWRPSTAAQNIAVERLTCAEQVDIRGIDFSSRGRNEFSTWREIRTPVSCMFGCPAEKPRKPWLPQWLPCDWLLRDYTEVFAVEFAPVSLRVHILDGFDDADVEPLAIGAPDCFHVIDTRGVSFLWASARATKFVTDVVRRILSCNVLSSKAQASTTISTNFVTTAPGADN